MGKKRGVRRAPVNETAPLRRGRPRLPATIFYKVARAPTTGYFEVLSSSIFVIGSELIFVIGSELQRKFSVTAIGGVSMSAGRRLAKRLVREAETLLKDYSTAVVGPFIKRKWSAPLAMGIRDRDLAALAWPSCLRRVFSLGFETGKIAVLSRQRRSLTYQSMLVNTFPTPVQ